MFVDNCRLKTDREFFSQRSIITRFTNLNPISAVIAGTTMHRNSHDGGILCPESLQEHHPKALHAWLSGARGNGKQPYPGNFGGSGGQAMQRLLQIGSSDQKGGQPTNLKEHANLDDDEPALRSGPVPIISFIAICGNAYRKVHTIHHSKIDIR
jgi:hypothetical protein